MKNNATRKPGGSQQNPQAQTLLWIIQITTSTCICTPPQALFYNSRRSSTYTLPLGSSLQTQHISKSYPHDILLGFPSLWTVSYSIP